MNTASAKSIFSLRAGVAAAAAALILAAGCGPAGGNGATISGKATYKGEPLTGGTIKLHSDAPPVAGGADQSFRVAIKPDGTFAASNVPTGTMTVTIETQAPKSGSGPNIDPATGMPVGMKLPANFDPSQIKSGPAAAGAAPKLTAIPQKYADPKTSGLTWDIKPGQQTKDFALTD